MVNAAASSVAVTVKLLAVPRSRIAWMPAGMASCRKPAVLEKTSTSYGASAAPAGVAGRGQAMAATAAGRTEGGSDESAHDRSPLR